MQCFAEQETWLPNVMQTQAIDEQREVADTACVPTPSPQTRMERVQAVVKPKVLPSRVSGLSHTFDERLAGGLYPGGIADPALSGCQILVSKNHSRALLSARSARSGLYEAANVGVRCRSAASTRRRFENNDTSTTSSARLEHTFVSEQSERFVVPKFLPTAPHAQAVHFVDNVSPSSFPVRSPAEHAFVSPTSVRSNSRSSQQRKSMQDHSIQAGVQQGEDNGPFRYSNTGRRSFLGSYEMALADLENMALNASPSHMVVQQRNDSRPSRYNGTERQSFLGSYEMAIVDSENLAANASTAPIVQQGGDSGPSRYNGTGRRSFLGSYEMAIVDPENMVANVTTAPIVQAGLGPSRYNGIGNRSFLGSYAMAVVDAESTAADRPTIPIFDDNEPYQYNGTGRRSFLGPYAMAVGDAENAAANVTTASLAAPRGDDNAPQYIGTGKRSFIGSYAMARGDSQNVAANISTALVPLYPQTSEQSSVTLPTAPTYVLALGDTAQEPPMPNNIAAAGSLRADEMAFTGASEMQAQQAAVSLTSRSVAILDNGTLHSPYDESEEESDDASYSPAGKSEWWAPSRKATDCSFASRKSRARTESRLQF